MPHRPIEDWEEPEPDDEEEGDSSSELCVCPSCGEGVYEDCEQCPHCGDYITPRSGAPSAFSGRWLVFAVVLMVALTLLGVFLAI